MIQQVLNNPADLLDWKELALLVFGVLEAVFRLTPTDNDNSLWNRVSGFLKYILDYMIPNRKRGGGKHK
jgi:hypothetical protein